MGKNKEREKLDIFKNKLSEIDKKKAIITFIIIIFLLYKIIFSGGLGLLDRREKLNESSNSEINYSIDKKDGVVLDSEKKKVGKENVLSQNNKKSGNITIYITGAVANPGVISLDSNMRLDDALKKVGGTTKDADINRINLAMNLEDSQHYIIPYIGQDDKGSREDDLSAVSSNGIKSPNVTADNNTNNSSNSSSKESKININSADENQLQTITGVGPSTAKKIIDYREKEGKFSSIDDIKNISGIGDKKFENMKEYIDIK
ncbi:MAG: helix-hairpin-helix domain-containing protein [Peptostreptococcus sp.]|uniref:helix-hairpin-helix domain-containing protein n=1 Tax=Peptostreptococcus sp. TaxID=1262 RepID=UPI002FC59C94